VNPQPPRHKVENYLRENERVQSSLIEAMDRQREARGWLDVRTGNAAARTRPA
jgi:hypothetical protein